MEISYILTGDITKDSVANMITWLFGQLYGQNGKNITKLRFFISSTGGDIDSAIRLYAYLRAIPFEVHTFGFGQVDSAAVICLLAGAKRSAVKHCRFLVHEGNYTIGQQTAPLHNHDETLRLLKAMLTTMTDILSSETGRTPEEIGTILKEGKILSDTEAKEFGLIHELLDKVPL